MYTLYIMATAKSSQSHRSKSLGLSRTQIYLSGQQQAALDVLSKRVATTRSQLIRLAIERLLAAEEMKTAAHHTKRDRLRAIAGTWSKHSKGDVKIRELREAWSDRT